ncbi:protein GRIP isoform X2 [Juglans microcarpa x Juglans regia]|uniref:protein GRIP isoform X2 n=1 Tax=Juglans microcarpa x Juglans regia TaxID=2249226 RepID=UPI001B7E6131|nr:protein GRIP isoform X2 [Juglans microcarpa x Juglans regia]
MSETMAAEGGDLAGALETHAEDALKSEKHSSDMSYTSNGNLAMENGLPDVNPCSNDTYDQMVQMVTDLRFQNEFLKSQFEGLRDFQSDSNVSNQQTKASEIGDGESEDVKELREKIESLKGELLEEKQTRGAAEAALKHLTAAYSEADAKAQDLSSKLTEAQQKLDQEIKEREEKYSELDLKFSRLHKRAKQRIQDIQKEKDDLEARFREVSDAAERASSQQSSLQQEIERTRQQANDALKAMDAERQQLRSTNNKLRDTIEELRRSLQPKESALEALQQSLLEKEQMLEDMRGLLQAADEKRQASIAELSAKHQKNLESLEAQLADAFSDRSKATETISALQVLVAEKESKIAEMDAASTGEAARLRASVETVKGELAHLKHEHISRLENEFSSYKVRAHALLQKKDAELAASKESEQLKVLEEALNEAEKEVSTVSTERDRALQDLQNALANYDKELKERDMILDNAKQQIKNLEIKLISANASHQSDKEAWEMNLQNLEETWRLRCEAMKAQNEASSGEDLQRELEELKLRYKILKEEHDSFRDLADKMIEEKDKEMAKLLDDNKNLHQSLESRPPVDHYDNYRTAMQKQDAQNASTSAAEQQILLLARQQAQREEELAQSQRHILALQEEIEELERENRLHSQQEAILKAELRNVERTQKREGVDMTYLKNVILKLLETGEVEALLPVIGMLLQFSPEEIQKCQQAYRNSTDVPPNPATDASGSARSLFSRFSFS